MAGPRGEHDRAQFIALVTDAAERIAEAEGLRGLGMRRIAAAVGYAPNSIYNAVGDLDDIVLRVNARTVERLHRHLDASVVRGPDPAAIVLKLAAAYLDFVLAQPKLWSLLFEHVVTDGRENPPWLAAALASVVGLVDAELVPLIPDAEERARSVAALWASLHGIASLTTSRKLLAVSAADPHDLVRLLVGTFLNGIAAEAAKRDRQPKRQRSS